MLVNNEWTTSIRHLGREFNVIAFGCYRDEVDRSRRDSRDL